MLKLCDDKFLMPISLPPKIKKMDETSNKQLVSEEEKLKINKELREFVSSISWRLVNPTEAVVETPFNKAKNNNYDTNAVGNIKKSMGVACELCDIVFSAAKKLVENKVNDQEVLYFIIL